MSDWILIVAMCVVAFGCGMTLEWDRRKAKKNKTTHMVQSKCPHCGGRMLRRSRAKPFTKEQSIAFRKRWDARVEGLP